MGISVPAKIEYVEYVRNLNEQEVKYVQRCGDDKNHQLSISPSTIISSDSIDSLNRYVSKSCNSRIKGISKAIVTLKMVDADAGVSLFDC